MWRNACRTALVLTALALPAGAHEVPNLPYPPGAGVTAADGYLYEASKLADGVWLFASPEPFHIQPYGNVVAVEQADGFVLFDSGGTPAAATRILDMLATALAAGADHCHQRHPPYPGRPEGRPVHAHRGYRFR